MFEGIKKRLGIKQSGAGDKPISTPTQQSAPKKSLRERASQAYTKIKNLVSGKKSVVQPEPSQKPSEVQISKVNLKDKIIALDTKEKEIRSKLVNAIRAKNQISGTKTLTAEDKLALSPLKQELDLVTKEKQGALEELANQAKKSVEKLKEIGQKVNNTKQTLVTTAKPLVADKSLEEKIGQKQKELESARISFNEALAKKKSERSQLNEKDKQELLPLLKKVKLAEQSLKNVESTNQAKKNVQSTLLRAAKSQSDLVKSISSRATEAESNIKSLTASQSPAKPKSNQRGR